MIRGYELIVRQWNKLPDRVKYWVAVAAAAFWCYMMAWGGRT